MLLAKNDEWQIELVVENENTEDEFKMYRLINMVDESTIDILESEIKDVVQLLMIAQNSLYNIDMNNG